MHLLIIMSIVSIDWVLAIINSSAACNTCTALSHRVVYSIVQYVIPTAPGRATSLELEPVTPPAALAGDGQLATSAYVSIAT